MTDSSIWAGGLGPQHLARLRVWLYILSTEDNWMDFRNRVLATTDAACSGNPGPGGWALLLDDELRQGKLPCTTNSALELTANLLTETEHASHWAVDQRLEDQRRPLEREIVGATLDLKEIQNIKCHRRKSDQCTRTYMDRYYNFNPV